MIKAGKKTKEWNRVKVRLKKKFLDWGITHCEIRLEGCMGGNYLTWAHGKKRRHLEGNELEDLVVLACQSCHNKIEYLPSGKMLAIVELIITTRGKAVNIFNSLLDKC